MSRNTAGRTFPASGLSALFGLLWFTGAVSACSSPTGDGAESGGAGTSGGADGSGAFSTSGGSAAGGSQAGGASGAAHNSGGAPPSGGASAAGGSAGQTSGGQTSSSGGSTAASGGAAPSSGGGVALGSGGTVSQELVPLTIFLAGDSTVSTYTDTASTTDQAGWGQKLPAFLDERATVDNRAIGGRTARRFIDEGFLDEIWADAKPGDALFVQFGTNDGHKTATYELNGQTIPYYLDPDTDFKTYLMRYVDGARERELSILFVTPPPRNSAYCTGGNGTGAHAQAMRDLGEAEGVQVLDLNERTVTHLKAICPSPTPEDFFLLRSDGSVDGTHFQENGARQLAGFVVSELAESDLSLAAYVTGE